MPFGLKTFSYAIWHIIAKLNKKEATWFASRAAKSGKNQVVTVFIQLCLLLRCIFTAWMLPMQLKLQKKTAKLWGVETVQWWTDWDRSQFIL